MVDLLTWTTACTNTALIRTKTCDYNNSLWSLWPHNDINSPISFLKYFSEVDVVFPARGKKIPTSKIIFHMSHLKKSSKDFSTRLTSVTGLTMSHPLNLQDAQNNLLVAVEIPK